MEAVDDTHVNPETPGSESRDEGPTREPVEGSALQRLLSIDAEGKLFALAVDKHIRVLSLRSSNEVFQKSTRGTVRVLCFSDDGQYLMFGGDDKQICVVNTANWESIASQFLPKKISAGAFDREGTSVLAADRFGDVYRIPLTGEGCWPVLGHFCSIITSLMILQDGRRMITCDRDGVARMSDLPVSVSQGSFLVHRFFMGHTKFITSAAVREWSGHSVLLTGGGEGVVFVFDVETGRQLGKCDLGSTLLAMQTDDLCTVITLTACHAKQVVVAVVENQNLVFVLRYEEGNLQIHATFSMRALEVPFHLFMDNDDCLWMAGGSRNADSRDSQIFSFHIHSDLSLEMCTRLDPVLLAELESSNDEPELLSGGISGGSLSQALTRKQYSTEYREEMHKKRAYIRNAEYIVSVKCQRASTTDPTFE